MSCVRHLVEQEHVDVDATSNTQKYDALDFALWGQKLSAEPNKYTAVINYLKSSFPVVLLAVSSGAQRSRLIRLR